MLEHTHQTKRSCDVTNIPAGCIVSIQGGSGSGKTSFAMQAVAACQKQGGKAAVIDLDGSFRFNCVPHGIDTTSLIYSGPSDAEEAFQYIQKIVDLGNVELIVIDSANKLSTLSALDVLSGDEGIKKLHKVVKDSVPRLKQTTLHSNTTIIFTMSGSSRRGEEPKTGPLGVIDSFSDIIVALRDGKDIKKDGATIGITCVASVLKNKTKADLNDGDFEITF